MQVQDSPDAPAEAGREQASPDKGVTVLDADSMAEEDLQEAVGLLAQLEARACTC